MSPSLRRKSPKKRNRAVTWLQEWIRKPAIARMTQGKRQFNSLPEPDNYLIVCLVRMK